MTWCYWWLSNLMKLTIWKWLENFTRARKSNPWKYQHDLHVKENNFIYLMIIKCYGTELTMMHCTWWAFRLQTTVRMAKGHSPVLHCASLLRMTSRVISARALKWQLFLSGWTSPIVIFSETRYGELSFFLLCWISYKVLCVKYIWANSQCWARTSHPKPVFNKL